MDCHDARLLLTLQRREPEQLDRVELEALERHVELCPGCQNWNQSEARFESALTTALKTVPLPVGLKGKIASGLARSRPPRRKAWAAAAAAVLLGIVATGTYFWLQPTEIDPDQFRELVNDEKSVPDAVQSYFRKLGHRMTPPPQFEYGYLVTYKPVVVQGKVIPQLMFQCRRDNGGLVTAYVYCLPNQQFCFDGDLESPVSTGPNRQFEVLRGERELYVVDCAGGDLWMLYRNSL